MKNILLPFDFSPASQNAIEYALSLFNGSSCVFHLLSVYKSSKYTTGELVQASADQSIYDILIAENQTKLEQLIAKLKNSCAGEDYTFKAISDYDAFTNSINKKVEDEVIDLIIMGTDGASDTAEKILGSHTLRVIRSVNSPLLVIPLEAKFHRLQKVLISLDSTIDLTKINFQPILALMKNHTFSLEILDNVASKAAEAELELRTATLKKTFEGYPASFHKVSEIPFPEAISTFAQSMEIDLEILPVKKEEFLERILGSPLAKIIYGTKIPLLIVHTEENGAVKNDLKAE